MGVGLETAPKQAQTIWSVQTATVSAGDTAELPEWNWKDPDHDVVILYGFLSSGNLGELDLQLYDQGTSLSDNETVPAALLLLASAPSDHNVVTVGVRLTNGQGWKPSVKNNGTGVSNVRIVWVCRIVPRRGVA